MKYIIFILLLLPAICFPQTLKNKIVVPRKDVPVAFAKHRHGAKMSFDSNTDVYYPAKFHGIEAAHFAANLGMTAFVEPVFSEGFSGVVGGGRCEPAIYLATDRWKDYQPIPDYSATTWTSAGAAEFIGAVVGAAKSAAYPNHGQQMYDISEGFYGRSGAIQGTNLGQEALTLINYQVGNTLENPRVVSLRNGQRGIEDGLFAANSVLSARNSLVSLDLNNLINDYSDLEVMKRRAATTRFANHLLGGSVWGSRDTPITTAVRDNMESAFRSTMAAGGYFLNFSHFHMVYDDVNQTGDYAAMLADLDQIVIDSSAFVYSGGYQSIAEYIWLRENATVSAYEKEDSVKIETNLKNVIPLLNTFNSPITIQYDNSTWSGVVCVGCEGIRKDGSTYYLDVSVPSEVTLYEGPGSYYDYTIPSVVSQSVSGTTLTVTTNVPTKATVFRVATGGSIFGTTLVPVRSTTLSTTHIIDIGATAGFDFEVGLISEMGQSILAPVTL